MSTYIWNFKIVGSPLCQALIWHYWVQATIGRFRDAGAIFYLCLRVVSHVQVRDHELKLTIQECI